MARAKQSMRCVGVALMALMIVFAMTVGSFAATDASYNVTVYKDGETETSMADWGINKSTPATYDADTQTLTIPIQEITNDHAGYLYKGYITGIAFDDLEVSGTCELQADSIVIENFPAQSVSEASYNVTFTLGVYFWWDDDLNYPQSIPVMGNNPEADMVLSIVTE